MGGEGGEGWFGCGRRVTRCFGSGCGSDPWCRTWNVWVCMDLLLAQASCGGVVLLLVALSLLALSCPKSVLGLTPV